MRKHNDTYWIYEETSGHKVAYYMFVSRLRLGWTIEEAIKPEKRRNPRYNKK